MLEVSAQPRRIIVAFDGSESALRALDAAAQLTGYGSTLTVVSIAPGDEGRETLAGARELLLSRGVTARYVARSGQEAADEIVEAARELEADLIVVGRRARREDESVSAEVVRTAAGDVLVVA
jgi:nucleotide-binding universal stress UspA family protein